jgi:hypothetical protein
MMTYLMPMSGGAVDSCRSRAYVHRIDDHIAPGFENPRTVRPDAVAAPERPSLLERAGSALTYTLWPWNPTKAVEREGIESRATMHQLWLWDPGSAARSETASAEAFDSRARPTIYLGGEAEEAQALATDWADLYFMNAGRSRISAT